MNDAATHDGLTPSKLTDDIIAPLFRKPSIPWHGMFMVANLLTIGLFVAFGFHCVEGIGIFGINDTVGWGNYIVTYIYWIAIAVAGTLVSSILFLFRQRWRNAVNRSTEAMTVFAVSVAGLFPALHTGRPWTDYWLMPYPNDLGLWPQFKSPIVWDVFAITGYATTSVLFFYLGLIPDLATVRDRAKHPIQRMVYSALSLGWKGSASDWRHYERAYAQFAWLATPLVIGMHSTIATLVAAGDAAGWHATLFPPYFVDGAIFNGLGMALLMLIGLRFAFKFERYITIDHLERLAKIMLLCSTILFYIYLNEFYCAWYSESIFERQHFLWYRPFGPHNWAWFLMVGGNAIVPLLLWIKPLRRNLAVLVLVAIGSQIGMWFERFVITCMSLESDFDPANWSFYSFTNWDWFILCGSFGMFFTMFLGFVRVAPIISIAELKMTLFAPPPDTKSATSASGRHLVAQGAQTAAAAPGEPSHV